MQLSMRSAPVSIAFMSLALAACGKEEAPKPAVRPAIVVQAKTAGAESGQIYAGEVRPRYEASPGFRISGKIIERRVDVGARVKRGDVLMRIDAGDVALGASAASAAQAQAQADLALARAELARHRKLFDRNYISKSLLDTRQAAFDAASARLRQARAQASEAGNQTGYASLRADTDGLVTAVLAEPGQVVAAGTPVLRIAREGEVEIAIDVPEKRIAGFKTGQQAVVEIWALDNVRRTGIVREVSPQADAMSRTFPVRIAVKDATGLQYGMTARVGLTRPQAAGEVLVPLSAIDGIDGKTAVWRVAPATRKVARVEVAVLSYREDGALVSGLDADAWIVAAGVHKLESGQEIAPIDAKNRAVAVSGAGTASPVTTL